MNILSKLTAKSLKLNKKRTIVTLIGIILTGAMISGVTTLATSFQNFMINVEREDTGYWDISFQNVKYDNMDEIKDSDLYKDIFVTKEVSIAQINDTNQYVDVKGYEKQSFEKFNVKVVEGRYPENEDELLVNKTFLEKNNYKVGSTITLNLGKRLINGNEVDLSQNEDEQAAATETFEATGTKTYKIVGSTEELEQGNKVGFPFATYLDRSTIKDSDIVNISTSAKKVRGIISKSTDLAKDKHFYENQEMLDENLENNKYPLMYEGESSSSAMSSMIIAVSAILIAVIAVGSIVVIYNSFAISVSERTKQFGILSSIGATKKQIRKMVVNEGFKLGLIGIPVGIGSGVLGIWLTLKIVNKLLKSILVEGLNASLTLKVSLPILLISAVLIGITIFLSVIVPAKRASKISPIEAIRGSKDVVIKPRKLHTFKFLRKIYGIEGEIALKNLKRSKKRYRATIISLVISIVLFITFNGFVTYMFQAFNSLYMSIPFQHELSISQYGEDEINSDQKRKVFKDEIDNTIKELNNSSEIKRFSGYEGLNLETKLTKDNVDSGLTKLANKNSTVKKVYGVENEDKNIGIVLMKLDDPEYSNYLKENGLTELKDNQCIVVNYINGLLMYKANFNVFNYKENDKLSVNTQNGAMNLDIAKVTEKYPYGFPDCMGYNLVVVNEKTYEEAMKLEKPSIVMHEIYIEETGKDVTNTLSDKLQKIASDNSESIYYQNINKQMEMMNNLKTIIGIFLYGFIILISLIGVSNIFNTITTNINLRRREFANLKSIGMTDRAFNKMLNLECIFYGTKALLFGLPVGVGLCYALTKAFEESITFMFKIPWSSILISTVFVYLVVFITMMYASGKIKKENIIDVLRDDNI